MADYIERELIAGLVDAHGNVHYEDIEGIPSADVRENIHGHWVGIDDDPCETFECDVCGFVFDEWIGGDLYNFCPNCGADMRGDANAI